MIDIAFLTITTLLLILCRWWIQKRLQGLVLLIGGSKQLAIKLYSLIFLPGVIIHELSHFFAAALLAVPTGEITIFPRETVEPRSGESVTLGSVKVAKTDFFRSTLIGFAPFITGSIALYAIANISFSGLVTAPSLAAGLTWLGENLTLFSQWQTWLWLYAILALSNTMFMSKSDMRSWPFFFILLLLVIGVVFLAGQLSWLSQRLLPIFANLSRSLGSSFFLAVVIDSIAIVLMFAIEKILEKLTHRRIVYG